jgi:hypothetical protein
VSYSSYKDDPVEDYGPRIRELERHAGDARVTDAKLATSLEHLSRTVEMLNVTVSTLRDVMNQGRGALWLGMLLAGSLSATLALLIRRMLFGPG